MSETVKCKSCDWRGEPYFIGFSTDSNLRLELIHPNTPVGNGVCRWCGKSLNVWHPDYLKIKSINEVVVA
jgi:hypothetical protein